MKTVVVIPARYGSERFPGKPLALVHGKPMIQRAYEQSAQARNVAKVLVATDDERIQKAVEGFGGEVVMTRAGHPSGTDRLGEVAESLPDAELVINVQGDEPFVRPAQIEALAAAFENPEINLATLVRPSDGPEGLESPTIAKVVRDAAGFALYFSREVVPFIRDPRKYLPVYYEHVGMYAYRRETLLRLCALPEGMLEQAEKLEQLRWLENGYRIFTVETREETASIDTPQELEFVNQIPLEVLLGNAGT